MAKPSNATCPPNKEQILATYGEWWFRLWSFFLAWASHVANDGQSTCFQIVCNKNTKTFDRKMFMGAAEMGERVQDFNAVPAPTGDSAEQPAAR